MLYVAVVFTRKNNNLKWVKGKQKKTKKCGSRGAVTWKERDRQIDDIIIYSIILSSQLEQGYASKRDSLSYFHV